MIRSKLIAIVITSLLLSTSIIGCASYVSKSVDSQFDIELTDIGFKVSGISVFGLFISGNDNILSIPGDWLSFRVKVTPKESFTGEPFSVSELGNEDMGFETIIESRPLVYLAIFSKDGYYFHSTGPLIWTKEQLQLPDPSERDYYKTLSVTNRRTKSINISVPSSDKAIVAFLNDCNELVRKLEQDQWESMVKSSGLFGESVSVMDKSRGLFDKYFKLKIIDKDEMRNLNERNAE